MFKKFLLLQCLLFLLAQIVPAAQAQELSKEYFENYHKGILFYKWDSPKITDIGLSPQQAKFLLDDNKNRGFEFLGVSNKDIFHIARFNKNLYLVVLFLEQFGGCGNIGCATSVYEKKNGRFYRLPPYYINVDCNPQEDEQPRECFIVRPLFPDRD